MFLNVQTALTVAMEFVNLAMLLAIYAQMVLPTPAANVPQDSHSLRHPAYRIAELATSMQTKFAHHAQLHAQLVQMPLLAHLANRELYSKDHLARPLATQDTIIIMVFVLNAALDAQHVLEAQETSLALHALLHISSTAKVLVFLDVFLANT